MENTEFTWKIKNRMPNPAILILGIYPNAIKLAWERYLYCYVHYSVINIKYPW